MAGFKKIAFFFLGLLDPEKNGISKKKSWIHTMTVVGSGIFKNTEYGRGPIDPNKMMGGVPFNIPHSQLFGLVTHKSKSI